MTTTVKIKEGVICCSDHYYAPVAKIIYVAGRHWPEGQDLTITRGCEDCPDSSPTSRHPKGKAFDLRTRDLPETIDRQELFDKIYSELGIGYYGYFKRYHDKSTGQRIEWIHLQYNG